MGKTKNLEQIVLGPEHNGMRMTPEEFDAVEEWDENYVFELVEGVVVVSPPPSIRERGPNDILTEKGTYQTDILPGFELSMARVLESVDRWEED